ncbi:hypothetical protein V5799_003543 [Amblyomma americanum]|uniref:Sodium/calcium exchanger membrane region domain-containing protein n=1 Tax=Amblyomma americanum TaxID=6943 RepID=A0AAQ4D8N4_AMBAM
MASCARVHDLNGTALQCAFVRATADCGANDAWLAYTAFAYCGPLAPYLPLAAEALWLALLFLVLGTTADDFLCPALVVVSRTMRLSESVAGVTLLAFGNGAPDIISSLAGVEQSRPALVVGELLGAGTFVTAVVAGTVFLLCRFSLEPAPFLRDAVFYLGASFWTFWLFYAGAVTLGHAVGFLALYGSYIAVVLAGHILRAREEQQRRLSVASSGRRSSTGSMHRHHEHAIAAFMQASHEAERRVSTERVPLLPPPADPWAEFLAQLVPWDPAEWAERSVAGKVYDVVAFPLRFALVLTVPVVDYADARDNWCRPLNTLHCITAPVFAVAVLGFEVGNAWALAALAGAAVALLVWFSSSFESAPRYHFAFGYAGFALSVLWIYGVARELLGLLRTLGLVAAVSDAVLGLTVLAWGNSLGDLVTNVAVARQPYPRRGLAGFVRALLGRGLNCGGQVLLVFFRPLLAQRKHCDGHLTYLPGAACELAAVAGLPLVYRTKPPSSASRRRGRH